jgi:hypothetical protein
LAVNRQSQNNSDFEVSKLWDIRPPVRTLAEDICNIRYQETTSEDIEDFVCAAVTVILAVPQFKRLVAGFPLRRPGFASGQHVWFVVDKAALGQVFSEYFGFSCQSPFHQFIHHHNHPGLAQ